MSNNCISDLSRRDVLRLGAGAAMSAALGGIAQAAGAAQVPEHRIWMFARATQTPILPGALTETLSYRCGPTLSSRVNLRQMPGSYLGPIIRIPRGHRLQVNFTNQLEEPTTIHWHGVSVPEEMDGHPKDPVPPRVSRQYTFPILNRGGTYWYHPHPHMATAPQVYAGMAGVLIVEDSLENGLPLPRGDFDLPLVIQDRRFDPTNQLLYSMGGMAGMLGDRILVNGYADFVLSAATRVYRLRMLNGSNSRVYKLGWSDGRPLTVIGTDGGLLPAPVDKPYAMMSPGERVELWVDLRNEPVGAELTLRSLAFSGAGTSGGQYPSNGAAIDLMRVQIERKEPETLQLPSELIPFARYRIEDAVNASDPKVLPIAVTKGRWTLNGRLFEMHEVLPNETMRLNDLEVWEFTNDGPGTPMVHPIHVHGGHFQVWERTGGGIGYSTVRDGLIDEGWKDTILVMPYERVKVLIKHSDYTGLFMYHCHNLEHEDMGMMRNFRITA